MEPGLSNKLRVLEDLCRKDFVTLDEIVQAFGGNACFILSLFLSLPFLIPVPLPGLSTPFGIIIIIIGVGLATGRPLAIPKKWREKSIGANLMRKVLSRSIKVSSKIEAVIKPRIRFMSRFVLFRLINASLLIAAGFLLMLPMPPGLNFPPSLAIVLLSTGVLEEDGFLIALSYLIFALNMALFGFIALYGAEELWKLLLKI